MSTTAAVAVNEYLASMDADTREDTMELAADYKRWVETGEIPWYSLDDDGSPIMRRRSLDGSEEKVPSYSLALATISGDVEAADGVPFIYAIDHEGCVTIEAGQQSLRRVVLQPQGCIALELASPENAEKFVTDYNAQHPGGETWAESIDYLEVHRRAREAGY